MHSEFSFKTGTNSSFIKRINFKVFLLPLDGEELKLKNYWERMRPDFQKSGDRIAFIKTIDDIDFAAKMESYLYEVGRIETHLVTMLMAKGAELNVLRTALVTPGNFITVDSGKYKLMTVETEFHEESGRVEVQFHYDRLVLRPVEEKKKS